LARQLGGCRRGSEGDGRADQRPGFHRELPFQAAVDGPVAWRSTFAQPRRRRCDLCHSRAVTFVTEFTGTAMRARSALSTP
jgi:hypothetical protein